MSIILRCATLCVAMFIALLPTAASAADSSPLLPLPHKVVLGKGALQLNAPLAIAVFPPRCANPTGGVVAAEGVVAVTDKRIDKAVAHFAQTLAEKTHHAVCVSPCSYAVQLHIAWDAPGAIVQQLHEPETYTLDITDHMVSLHAAGPLGVLRGLQTLRQWLRVDADKVYLPAVRIEDKPRFAWRGLMLDAARHFMPPATVKRNLDAMAAVKMNVLHWHLSDDQGFRVESHRYPELTTHGAEGEFYTQAEVTDIIHYAADLGIRVVPEFDMPGHTSSWLISHPELGSAPGPNAKTMSWGIFDTALDPTKESTYIFVDNLLQEMSKLFPDTYFHIGGDEVTGIQWQKNPNIAAFMLEHKMPDTLTLQNYFVHRVVEQARHYGKSIVGWDEILQPNLPPNTVVQSWRGPAGIRQTLDAGYSSILSHGWYLGSSAAMHYLNDPADGLDTVAHGNASHLLGGEACQWSELVTSDLVDASVWPRTAAVAERLWSDASVRDVPDMYRRLAIQSDRLVALGMTHRSFQQRRLVELAGTPDVAPLQKLADVLESNRANWWPEFRVKRPLDGFTDVLYAESEHGRELSTVVDALLAHPDDKVAAKTLIDAFQSLYDNDTAVTALVKGNPHLQAIAPVAHDVAKLSHIGLQAVDALAQNVALPPQWATTTRDRLRRAEIRALGVQIALAPAVSKLVDRLVGPAPVAAVQ